VRLPIFLSISLLYLGGTCAASEDTGAAALETLRGLAGDWEGSFQWSGSRGASGKMNASYYSTANGSAVVENLIMDGVPMMTSVYHLDVSDLRMTHYCAAQNQPRFKASRINIAGGVVDFSVVDITNLPRPEAGHVAEVELRFLAGDHIRITFRFDAGGKTSREQIDLTRVTPKQLCRMTPEQLGGLEAAAWNAEIPELSGCTRLGRGSSCSKT
jgi:hypothetical protein